MGCHLSMPLGMPHGQDTWARHMGEHGQATWLKNLPEKRWGQFSSWGKLDTWRNPHTHANLTKSSGQWASGTTKGQVGKWPSVERGERVVELVGFDGEKVSFLLILKRQDQELSLSHTLLWRWWWSFNGKLAPKLAKRMQILASELSSKAILSLSLIYTSYAKSLHM